jgi:hypothetical protein
MNRTLSLVLGVLVVAVLLGFTSVALADDAKGTIKSADKDKLVVTDKDKKDLTFAVNDKTKVTVTYKKDGDKIIVSKIAAS